MMISRKQTLGPNFLFYISKNCMIDNNLIWKFDKNRVKFYFVGITSKELAGLTYWVLKRVMLKCGGKCLRERLSSVEKCIGRRKGKLDPNNLWKLIEKRKKVKQFKEQAMGMQVIRQKWKKEVAMTKRSGTNTSGRRHRKVRTRMILECCSRLQKRLLVETVKVTE